MVLTGFNLRVQSRSRCHNCVSCEVLCRNLSAFHSVLAKICFRLASGVLPIGALFYITDVVAQKTRKVLGALLARRYIEVN